MAAAKKAIVKGSAKKAAQRSEKHEQFAADARKDIPEFSASGLDAALDLLDLTSGGTQAKSSNKIERHPEKRMKSAWASFEVSINQRRASNSLFPGGCKALTAPIL